MITNITFYSSDELGHACGRYHCQEQRGASHVLLLWQEGWRASERSAWRGLWTGQTKELSRHRASSYPSCLPRQKQGKAEAGGTAAASQGNSLHCPTKDIDSNTFTSSPPWINVKSPFIEHLLHIILCLYTPLEKQSMIFIISTVY